MQYTTNKLSSLLIKINKHLHKRNAEDASLCGYRQLIRSIARSLYKRGGRSYVQCIYDEIDDPHLLIDCFICGPYKLKRKIVEQ